MTYVPNVMHLLNLTPCSLGYVNWRAFIHPGMDWPWVVLHTTVGANNL